MLSFVFRLVCTACVPRAIRKFSYPFKSHCLVYSYDWHNQFQRIYTCVILSARSAWKCVPARSMSGLRSNFRFRLQAQPHVRNLCEFRTLSSLVFWDKWKLFELAVENIIDVAHIIKIPANFLYAYNSFSEAEYINNGKEYTSLL